MERERKKVGWEEGEGREGEGRRGWREKRRVFVPVVKFH